MPNRTITEIRSLARGHTRRALNVLVGVMCSKDATATAKVAAANAILDRGWGSLLTARAPACPCAQYLEIAGEG